MARARAAGFLVVVYAMCLVTPVAGFAFGNSEMAVHCLTGLQAGELHAAYQHDMPMMTHEGMTGHVMGDDFSMMHHTMSGHINMADHHMADRAGNHTNGHHKDLPGPACCGMMCISALPTEIAAFTLKIVGHSVTVISADVGIPGEAPARLYRPPIALLS